jgi:hypothetical protein
MGTPTGSSGVSSSGEAREKTAPERVITETAEGRQPVGYRIRDTRPTEPPRSEQPARKTVHRRQVAERVVLVIDYAFSLLYGLLGLRLVLGLIGANENAGFVRFMVAITQPFYAPFVDIVPSPTMADGAFELPLIVAIWVYLLVHLAIRRLLHVVFGTRQT